MKIKSLKYVEVSNAKYVENYLGNTAINNMVFFYDHKNIADVILDSIPIDWGKICG